MSSRIWLLNMILAAAVLTMAAKVYSVWTRGLDLPVPPVKKVRMKDVADSPAVIDLSTFPERRYAPLVERNPFSPERGRNRLGEEETAVVVTENVKPATNIKLYGVVMAGDFCRALITNPDRKSGQRPNIWVETGQRIGDYRIEKIEKDRVILSKKGIRYQVELFAPGKRRGAAAPRSARPAHPGAASSKKVITIDVPKPKPKPGKISRGESKIEAGQGGYEIIKTPFGNIRRKKK